MLKKTWFTLAMILCGAWVWPATTLAQTASGGLRGVVTDASATAILSVRLTARNVNTGVEILTTSNNEGLYMLPRLIPGSYNISAEAPGFKKSECTQLDAGNFNSLNNLEKASGRKAPAASLDNQIGYAVGGPAIKKKIFFFTSGWFRCNPATTIFRAATMSPTPEALQSLKTVFLNNPAIQYLANYSAFALPLGNPRARTDIAPSTLTLGSAVIPVAAVERSVSTPTNVNEYTARGDANLTNNHRVWSRYFWQKSPNPNVTGGANGFFRDVPQLSKQLGGGHVNLGVNAPSSTNLDSAGSSFFN